MWLVSEKFKETIATDHTVVQRAEILQDGEVVADLMSDGVFLDGNVTVSRSAVERTGSCRILDTDGTFTPNDIQDLLVPDGNELRLWRGVLFPGSTVDEQAQGTDRELVPLGTFRFTTVNSTYPEVVLSEMYDRSWIVAGAKFETIITITAGTLVTTAIESLLKRAYPSVQVDFVDTDEVTSLMTFESETDPWEVCQQLAANIGMRLFFDQMGVCTMRPEPDPDLDPIVWTYDNVTMPIEGRDEIARRNLMLPGLEMGWQGTCFNAVIVVGENSALPAPVRYVAYDLNPNSPTKYGGKYGKRLAPVIRDEKIVTVAQAQARAKRTLMSQIGLYQRLTVPSMVNPAFEIDDVIHIRYHRDAFEIDQVYVIDGFDVPMRASNSMRLDTRLRRVMILE